MQANVKPPSPMLAPKQQPLKPPSPLQAKNAPKTPISHPQRRWRFQLGLGLREQRRWWFHLRLALREQRRCRFQLGLALREQRRRRFHARDFQCPRAMAEPGRHRVNAPSHTSATRRHWCGGRRRVRRARAGFEIDHSEPQARVWRSRGRPGPTAPGTTAEPQASSSIANSGCTAGVKGVRGPGCGARNNSGATSIKLNREFRLHRRCEGRKRARPQRPWAVAGPGRASRRRAEPLGSRRGRRAGGPPPTGAPSSPAQQGAPSSPAQQGAQSSPAPQGTAQPAISGSRAPSGSPTRKQHPPGQASAPNRRRRARDPRPRR